MNAGHWAGVALIVVGSATAALFWVGERWSRVANLADLSRSDPGRGMLTGPGERAEPPAEHDPDALQWIRHLER